MFRNMKDGSIMSVRTPPKGVVAKMDKKYIRAWGDSYKWWPKTNSLNKIKKIICGHDEIQIVGKGPSLDSITKDDFNLSPIFCINESIHKIETLQLPNKIFCIQQDGSLGNVCKPKSAYLLVSKYAAYHYEDCDQVIPYTPEEIGARQGSLTALAAIGIAKHMEINKLRFLCFDAITNGDTNYAVAIGKKPIGNQQRFVGFGNVIKGACIDMEVEFIDSSYD